MPLDRVSVFCPEIRPVLSSSHAAAAAAAVVHVRTFEYVDNQLSGSDPAL